MKKSKFSEAQIVYAIRENESGTKVAEITRRLGISQATFFTWKKKYGDMGVTEFKRLRAKYAQTVPLIPREAVPPCSRQTVPLLPYCRSH